MQTPTLVVQIPRRERQFETVWNYFKDITPEMEGEIVVKLDHDTFRHLRSYGIANMAPIEKVWASQSFQRMFRSEWYEPEWYTNESLLKKCGSQWMRLL